MSYLKVLLLLSVFFSASASADVWKWFDAKGNIHFVDTNKAIFTWVGDDDKLYYSDTPDHKDAVAVQLVWHSAGSLQELNPTGAPLGQDDFPGETDDQRLEREMAEAYYCKRATEIYDSYVNAPRLYKTNDDGEKEYLSEAAAAAEIADTKSKKDELCE
jgi:hypothetical protein